MPSKKHRPEEIIGKLRADSDDPGRLFRSDPGHYSEVKPDGPSQIVGR